MGSTMEDRRSQASLASPRESFAGHKSIRMPTGRKRSDSMAFSADLHGKSACTSKKISSFVSDDSDVFNMATLPERIDLSKYGSVAKEIEALILLRKQKQRCDLARHPSLPCKFPTLKKNQDERVLNLSTEQAAHPVHHNSIGMVDIFSADGVSATMPITIVDSDDEDKGNEMMGNLCGEVLLGNPVEQVTAKETMEIEVALEEKEIDTEFMDICMSCGVEVKVTDLKKEGKSGTDSGNCKSNYIWPVKSLLFDPKDTEVKPDEEQTDTGLMKEGVLFGIQGEATELKKEENCKSEHGNDDLGNIFPEMASVGDCSEKTKAASEEEQTNTVSVEEDILSGVEDYSTESDKEGNHRADRENDDQLELWSEMLFAFESSKDVEVRCSSGGQSGLDCDHSFLLRDDIGYVCRICGIVQKKIEKIFDFQYKVRRTGRTYNSQCWDAKDREPSENTANGAKSTEQDLGVGIYAHPRHRKQMKPHQVEGFNFLVSNLLMDNPGGCILAHAPGSGKTFMIISFLQSFLARYPDARPLVVLPKGILGTWRKEFQTWQIQDMPLYDFYSCKAENRAQQLSLLDKWVEKNGILFLGYKQFATIICDAGTTKASAACREMLLNVPKILILDEGHTPRNESTDVLQSLRQVRTARKVVLSGTLYQNHVKEVFNILDLVRPKFLRSDNSRAIVKRVMSKVDLSSCARRQLTSDQVFYDAVEYTLLKDDDISRKTTVVRDLREMTCKVLHYYKGDFLDELPGLVDFTVLLHVTAKQRSEVEKLKKLDQFKRSSVGSAIYVHPRLKHYLDNDSETKDRGSSIDEGKLEKVLEKLDVGDGVKAKFFLHMLGLCESTGEKVLVFSQYLLPLNFLERLTKKYKCWEPGREIFMISGDSSPESREWSMERFNSSPDAKVLFGSIKACGEGISLVGASRILILDVHLNPSVTRQAIGRAHRPGQKKKVYTYRLVAADSPEENDHFTCLKKESISKMWFEWNDCYGHFDLNLRTVDVNASGDTFLRSPLLQEDVKVLYRR